MANVLANVPEVVLDLYNGVPNECFVAGLPFELRGFDDNEVVPFSLPLPAPDGAPAKWIRFCDFLPFLDACKTHWMERSQYPVYVYVMPYTPLRDAFHLHEIIENADELTHGDSMALDQESGAAAPNHRQGLADVSHGTQFLRFTVVNYNLLRSKAHKYHIFSYVSDALRDCEQRLDVSSHLITSIPRRLTPGQLSDAIHATRRRLVLSLLEGYAEDVVQDMDLHSAIFNIFPQLHDEAYEDICHHCHPNHYPAGYEDTVATRTELDEALQRLRDEEIDVNHRLSICDAEFNLLSAEGAWEFDHCNANSRGKFLESQSSISTAIKPALDYVREVTTSHSLMGV